MDTADVRKQLEFYSNAIVAFVVLQGLAFCYTFGTETKFNDVVKHNALLSWGLAFLFLLVLLGALYGNYYLRRNLEPLSGEYSQIVKHIYGAKALVMGFFGAIPVIVLVRFAI